MSIKLNNLVSMDVDQWLIYSFMVSNAVSFIVRIVFADNNTDQGLLHAPFRIDNDGDRILLLSENAVGARTVVDGVDTVALGRNQAMFRSSVSGVWLVGDPSPNTSNISEAFVSLGVDDLGNRVVTYVFPTEEGKQYTPEFSEDLRPGNWSADCSTSTTRAVPA